MRGRAPLLTVAFTILTAGCGARSELPAPRVVPGEPPSYCTATSDTSVYVVTEQNELYRFDPPSQAFDLIGVVQCPVTDPGSPDATPFSMAVDHQGKAYVLFGDGELFEVSGATAACSATSVPFSTGSFGRFGMGYSTDPDGLGETLYVAGEGMPGQLGTLDTTAFDVQAIGPYSTDIGDAELTGTGDGRLFGFGVEKGLDGSHLAEIDKTNASILSDQIVPTPASPQAWAFAFWGGDFYFFTSTDNVTTSVGRLHPGDSSFDASYAALPTGAVTGAGVSTCAPQ
jgi:hypothetical protein